MPEEYSDLRVLRLFGLDNETVAAVVRRAAQRGCPGLRLGQRDGEHAICIQSTAESKARAVTLCDQWEDELRATFGPALYAVGGQDLPMAAVAALSERRRLIVAADAESGRMLNDALKPIEAAQSVYDFGTQSYDHPKHAAKLNKVPGWAKKGDAAAGRAAARAAQALKYTTADYALTVVPSAPGRPLAAMLCTRKQGWMRALPGKPTSRLVSNWMLELVRRHAADLPMPDGVQEFVMGKPVPAPAMVFAKMTVQAAPGFTSTAQAVQAAQESVQRASALEAEESARQAALEKAAKLEEQKQMEAELAAREAARKAAEQARCPQPSQIPTAEEDAFAVPSRAVLRTAAEQTPQQVRHAAETAKAALHPAVFRAGMGGMPTDEMIQQEVERKQQEVRVLYGMEAPPRQEFGWKERPKRRGGALTILICTLLVVLLAAGTALGVVLWRSNHAEENSGPAFRGYGTADFDAAAQSYVIESKNENGAVRAYLALSGQPGALIYGPGGNEAPAHPGAVLAASPQSEQPGAARQVVCFSGQADLKAPHHNSLIYCPASAMNQLAQLTEKEHLRNNCGFSVYDGKDIHRYKVAAVFYWDPSEQGPSAFELERLQDLTNYEDYMQFVLGIKMRSLYELAVDIEDGDSFVSLLAEPSAQGQPTLAVVGRRQREGENARLERSAIMDSEQPLYTARQYQQAGQTMPALEPLSQYWTNWYLTQGITASDNQEEQGMPKDDISLDELIARIDAVNDKAEDVVNATPPPVATEKPTSTSTPSSGGGHTVVPKPIPPQEGGDLNEGPDVSGGSTAPTTTLNVTMNGTPQTMDVTQCLAMIAQNELGYNQPAEAYKAQAVAAHSWILTQGSYPAVSGRTPTQEVLDAVATVANQVVTYNGSVAFTPYFASAAYGTCPSEAVWGTSRDYLVAVESPYDKDYATHWQTTREFSRAEVQSRVAERLGVDLAAYSSDPSTWLGDLEKNSSGYVLNMRVGNARITGGRLRTDVLSNVPGRKNLRSSAFDVAYNAGSDQFVFTVWGYGHGCGLSQSGAIGYARNGASYSDILAHYFPGTQLSPI